MDDVDSMKKLVELMCGKKVTILKEMEPSNSSIASCLLAEDLPKKIEDVLYMRRQVVYTQWKYFFDKHSRTMLSSHVEYLTYIMVACNYEHRSNKNIFDSFISVCALVLNFSSEIFSKTNVNFGDLNPDIIIIFYLNVLKKKFHKRGVFPEFVKYIRGHKYLAWNWKRKDFVESDKSTYKKMVEKDFRCYHKKVIIDGTLRDSEGTNLSLAEEVLSKTSVELPTLPSEPDLIMRLVAFRKKKMAGVVDIEKRIQTSNVDLRENSSLNSDSITNYAAKDPENITHYEDIIQAVIKHNHLRKSDQKNTSNQFHKKADDILEHLKKKITSIIEVLDESDKE